MGSVSTLYGFGLSGCFRLEADIPSKQEITDRGP